MPYAQKVFPFQVKYGIGTYGAGQIAGRTVYFAIREFENLLHQRSALPPPTAKLAAETVGGYLQELFESHCTQLSLDLNGYEDSWAYLGLQVVGYDDKIPKSYNVRIGKHLRIEEFSGLDVTLTGQWEIFEAIRDKVYAADPLNFPLFEAFSLQDAIEYAEFLIRMTAEVQRFSRHIPTVGGNIDVAVVTPFDHFQWIRQKPLYKHLGESPHA